MTGSRSELADAVRATRRKARPEPAAKPERPQTGGSYVRLPDGTLKPWGAAEPPPEARHEDGTQEREP